MVLFACQQKSTVPLPYATLWQESNSNPQQVKSSIAPDSVFNSGWKYVKGLPGESLLVAQLPEPDSIVTLPHRVLSPNTALWYRQIISFPEDGELHLRADDGAQLWINGVAAERTQGDAFKVYATEDVAVLIRVLNNAMSGGLKSVSYFTQRQVELLREENKQHVAEKRKYERSVLQVDLNDALWVGPWLTRTDSMFTIRLMAVDVPVKLHWGLAPDKLINTQQQTGNLVTFNIKIPASNWYYKICSGGYCTSVYTVAADTENFSFSIWGDSQSGWYNFQKHMQHIGQQPDAFTVGVGDLVGNGCEEEEWRTFAGLLSTAAANRPAYLVAGNHDYDGSYSDLVPRFYHQYASPAGKPYFMWTYANCAFLALDPNAQFPIGFSAEQKDWFHQQIQSSQWQAATWRFVFVHQPPYSQGWAGYEGDKVVRDLLEPVLETARIDFVIAGHTHDYERLEKQYGQQRTHFIITGGGGGSLEPVESSLQPVMDTVLKTHHYIRFKVSDNRLEWLTHNSANKIIDKQILEK